MKVLKKDTQKFQFDSKLKFKVGLLLTAFFVALIISGIFIAFQKGVFTKTITYTLISKTGNGLSEGMPVMFSGFEIGKVDKLELSEDGEVEITIKIPVKHEKWIRKGTKFTLEKPLIGSSAITIKTENMNTPLLDHGEIQEIDVIDDINEVIKQARPVLDQISQITQNINYLTNKESDISKTLANVKIISKKIKQKDTVIEMITGKKSSAKEIAKLTENLKLISSQTLKSINKINQIIDSTQTQVTGKEGILSNTNTILKDLIKKLKKMDKLIKNINKTGKNVANSTTDLKEMENQINELLNTSNQMIKQLNSYLPSDKKEIKLP